MDSTVKVHISTMFKNTEDLQNNINDFIKNSVEGPNGIFDFDVKSINMITNRTDTHGKKITETVFFAVIRYVPKTPNGKPLEGTGGELH